MSNSYITNSYYSLEVFLKGITIPLAVVLIIWISEFLFIKKSKLSILKFSFKEFILWIIHYTPISNIGALISTFGIFYSIKKLIKEYHFVFFDDFAQYEKIIIFIILIDLFGYFVHYLLHKIDFLWHFHKFHHSAEEFNVLTVHRVHFFEVSLLKFTHTFVFVILGGDFELFTWYYVFTVLLGHLKHSNFKFNYPWFFKYLVQSPAHHWVHHSKKKEHYNKNFGEIFQLWDTLFNTGYNPNEVEVCNISIGTADTKKLSNNFTKLFFYPYKIVFLKFKSRLMNFFFKIFYFLF